MLTTTGDPTTATAATTKQPLVRLLLRPVPQATAPAMRAAVGGAIVLGAGMNAASALIHLHLWMIGYKHIHLIGPAFLFQAVSGLALAAIMLAYRRLITV